MRHIIAVSLIAATAFAADAPKPPASPQLPDAVRFKVLSAYRKAMQRRAEYDRATDAACAATPQCAAARDAFSAAATNYNASIPGWMKEAGLPDGSTISVINDATDAVEVTVPAPPAPPAPTPAKDAPKK